ncbi:hypothetical protein ACQF4J_47645 (plasmid) [Streptomyces sp. C1-1]|uniref:hypothetical protein n=1 Tax=Streptomyces sp. C1-1 TaxID=3231173 RepID=UPI003D06FFDD
MRTHIAEVLARESACLAVVTDRAKLADWRRRVVEELMTPSSPYVLALRQTGDLRARADFLDQWRELIAEAVDRLLKSGAPGGGLCTSHRTRQAGADAQKIAVLILAALQGGSTLSRIARDPRPLNAALDLALVPLAATKDDFLDGDREDR